MHGQVMGPHAADICGQQDVIPRAVGVLGAQLTCRLLAIDQPLVPLHLHAMLDLLLQQQQKQDAQRSTLW
jgi:hypothetical protein